MSGPRRRHRAALLLIVAALLWWHRWVPALLVVGVMLWLLLHRRLEDNPAHALARAWRRAWPPPTAVLIVLLAGGALAYWASDQPVTPKLLPVTLNVLALGMLVLGPWWSGVQPPARSRPLPNVAGSPTPRAGDRVRSS